MQNTLIIAIDGLSGSGKGSVAKMLAKQYNMKHLETGLLYRALGYYVSTNNLKNFCPEETIKFAEQIDIDNIKSLPLDTEEVAKEAAVVGKIPQIREILTKKLQEYVTNSKASNKSIILDGRDIGTCVCPQADLKFFLTASLKVRALRRFKQLSGLNKDINLEQVEKALMSRDNSDKYFNELAKNNTDYNIIDNTNLTLSETFSLFTTCINRYLFVD